MIFTTYLVENFNARHGVVDVLDTIEYRVDSVLCDIFGLCGREKWEGDSIATATPCFQRYWCRQMHSTLPRVLQNMSLRFMIPPYPNIRKKIHVFFLFIFQSEICMYLLDSPKQIHLH